MRLDEQPGETNARRGGGNDARKTTARQPNRVGVKRSLPEQRDDGCAGGGNGQKTLNAL